MNNHKTDQEIFWTDEYAEEYVKNNSRFNRELGVEAWRKMLAKASGISRILECGCNIGRNVGLLNAALPEGKNSIVEISEPAYSHVMSQYAIEQGFNGAITDSRFEAESFDLVFTTGVLIHIHPDNLLANMEKMFAYSKKYILIGEYFNRTPVMLTYQGRKDKLFKSDFGKLFMENFDAKLVDYGFLWGHIYDAAGFDDITWWLFEKN